MEAIKIELVSDELPDAFKGWKVSIGNTYADGLGYDEMLGLIAALTMPQDRPTLQWMKTKEQHEAFRTKFS